MLGITRGAEDRSKPGVGEVSGLVLLGGYFEVTWDGNIEGEGTVEGDTLCNKEGTGVGNKLVIYDGKVLYVRVVYIRRIGVEESADLVSSYGYFEGVRYSNLDGAVSVTKYYMRQGSYGEVFVITYVVSDRKTWGR